MTLTKMMLGIESLGLGPPWTNVEACVENNDGLQNVEGPLTGCGEDVNERLNCEPCSFSLLPFEEGPPSLLLLNEIDLVNGGDPVSPS